jgi:hypothetical protein
MLQNYSIIKPKSTGDGIMNNQVVTEYCRYCRTFPSVAHIKDVPICTTCLNDAVDPEELSRLENRIDNLEDYINSLKTENFNLRSINNQIVSKNEELNLLISQLQGRTNITIDEGTVIDLIGCSKEMAAAFLDDKEVERKIRGYLLLRADDRIYELFPEFREKYERQA